MLLFYFIFYVEIIFLQLYEQILAENEKLKAQLRDTDLELADLKLQLEKATQVSLHYFIYSFFTNLSVIIVFSYMLHLSFLFLQRQERYADRSQLEMEKRVITEPVHQPLFKVLYNTVTEKITSGSCVSQTNFLKRLVFILV